MHTDLKIVYFMIVFSNLSYEKSTAILKIKGQLRCIDKIRKNVEKKKKLNVRCYFTL